MSYLFDIVLKWGIMISIKKEVYEEIVRKLKEEAEYYEAIVKKFEKMYGCSLEELEKKIEKEGVPIDNYEIWEDSIEWRNAVEELEKLKKLLEELNSIHDNILNFRIKITNS